MDVYDEESLSETPTFKRFSVNTRLSAARIFEEESSDSVQSTKSIESNNGNNKMKTSKKNGKKAPYSVKLKKNQVDYETDPEILDRRQKQIDYGKNTTGYDNYRKLVPMSSRTKDHPRTPCKYLKYSRRGWDGLIKMWRQKLHEYDPDEQDMIKEDSSSLDDELTIPNETEELI